MLNFGYTVAKGKNLNANLSKAMETALIRISEGRHAGATPGTWRALKDRGLIEYRADGTLLSKLTAKGEDVVQSLAPSVGKDE